MNRRTILQLTGTTLATGLGMGTTSATQEGDENGREDGEKDEYGCEPEIQFGEHELIIDESGFSSDAYAAVDVENVGAAASGEISVTVSWIDDQGSFIDDDSTSLPTLGTDETLRAYVSTRTDPEEIDEFEVGGEFELGQPRTPSGLSIAESSFDYGENEIAGVVENTREEDIERVEAHGKMLDEDGTVLGGGSTWEREHLAGRDWNFEIRTPRLPGGVEPTGHEVMLDARSFQIR